MNILGIDPGSRNLGFCVLDFTNRKIRLVEAGVIKVKSKNLQEQISEIVEGIDIIFNNNHIDEVAMEDIFFAYNPQSVLKLAQVRGAILLKLIQLHGNIYEYTALQVKKSITGNGKATKEQVAYMVQRLLGIKKEIRPLDITDAMGVAITHSQRVSARR